MSFSNPYAWWRLQHRLVKPSHDLEHARRLPEGDGYDCPNCEGELKLAKGEVVPPYFAHVANADLELCTEESVLLKTAKLLLAQAINDWVKGDGIPPSLRRECDRCRRYVTGGICTRSEVTRAEAEFAPPPLRQDVSVLGQGGALILAIQVRAGTERPAVQGPWLELSARAILEDPLNWKPLNWGGLDPIASCIGCQQEEADSFKEVEVTNPYMAGEGLAGKIFGPGGLMSKTMEGYEEREGQRKLAAEIDAAIRAHASLMGEGPCGTGKSAAYLAIVISHALHTGGTVIVSTANKSLQDQLYDKDVPMVLKALGKTIRYEIMRGRGNYVCQGRLEGWERTRAEKAQKEGMFSKPESHEEHPISAWASISEDGDVMRAAFEIDGKVKSRVCGARNECSMVCGATARTSEPCFYQQARKRAKEATLVITNHAMLFAHLSVKKKVGGAILLPDAEIIVADEGHELVEYARSFFETSYSEGRYKRLGLNPEDRERLEWLESKLFRVAQEATQSTDGNIDSPWLNGRGEDVGQEIIEEISEIEVTLDLKLTRTIEEISFEYGADMENLPADVKKRLAEAKTHHEEAKKARKALQDVLEFRADEEAKSPKAYWLERGEYRSALKGCPVDVSKFIRESLFADKAVSTIVTSATLTTSGSFDHLGKEIGFGTQASGYVGRTVVVESPFNFERQSIVVVPDAYDMPHEPSGRGRKAFMDRSAELFKWIAEQTGGGILFLFASRAGMNAVSKKIPRGFPFKILVQGDMSTKRLKEEFKNDPNSCLFGLKTFWAGLDIQGHALRCVIVDKMPFIPPSDPFQRYRQKNFSRDVAMNYMVEAALLQLRQGVGRLIRTSSDGGAVVILDRRILSRPSYSGKVMKSLPWAGRPQEGLGALQRYFA